MINSLIQRFLPYIGLGIIIIIMISFGYGYYKGYNDAESKIQYKTIIKEVHDVQVRGNVEKKVMALPDPDLDQLLDKWMRD